MLLFLFCRPVTGERQPAARDRGGETEHQQAQQRGTTILFNSTYMISF